MRRCVKRSVEHVVNEGATRSSARTTRSTYKRQKLASDTSDTSDDSAITSSILVPHNGDKALDVVMEHGIEGAERALVTALMSSSQGSDSSAVSTRRPRRLSARRTKYELREQEDTRLASAEEQRTRRASVAGIVVGADQPQVVAAAQCLVLLKHTVPSRGGSKRSKGSKGSKAVKASSNDPMWSNLDLLATAACELSCKPQASGRRLRPRK